MRSRYVLTGLLVCLVLAGCGTTTTVTTTTNPGPPPTVTSISRAHTGQSWFATYGSVLSAVVALTIAVSGTFAFLRRPRLTLTHDPERFSEDRVAASNTGWWWRLRVSNAQRRWHMVVPRTAQEVEVFVVSLRQIPSTGSGRKPVVSGRRLPWTLSPEEEDKSAPARIPAGTFRYLDVVGPRRWENVEPSDSAAAMPLMPPPDRSDPGRYDLAAHPGTWEAEIVVSAEDIRATRWLLTAEVPHTFTFADVTQDAVKITVQPK